MVAAADGATRHGVADSCGSKTRQMEALVNSGKDDREKGADPAGQGAGAGGEPAGRGPSGWPDMQGEGNRDAAREYNESQR